MLAAPVWAAAGGAPQPPPQDPPVDQRLAIVRNLFAAYHSPLQDHAQAFLTASDKHRLDWRLLPSLVILETGGRHYNYNNIFGWGNGESRFPSVANAIEVVAKYLSTGAPYRGKSFEGKMRAYNPSRSDYGALVAKMMAHIAAAPASPAVAVGPN